MAILPGMQINLTQSQQLKMTPQLQQSIKILQQSSLEIQQMLSEALEENLFLELEEEELPRLSLEQDTPDAQEERPSPEPSETPLEPENTQLTEEIEEVDTNWSDVYEDTGSGPITAHGVVNQEDYTSPENYTAAEKSLHDYLMWQAEVYSWDSELDATLAEYIIDEIDDDGYFTLPLADFAEQLTEALELPISEADIERVLAVVQQFEPTGVGARDLRECLLLQLYNDPIIEQEDEQALYQQALDLIENHFELLSTHQYKRIKRRYKLDDEGLQALINYIQRYDPRPGRKFAIVENSYIMPDLILKRSQDGFILELNPEAYPSLRLNEEYITLVQKVDDPKQALKLKNKLTEAKNLIKSLKHRGETLLRVGRFIVERQKKFFEEGEKAMQPMVLREVAEALDLHESTISRATNQKYIQTPRGTYELKFFFSAGVSQYGDEDQSSVAIKSYIKEFIEAEDKHKPLSDNKIMKMLEEKGIHVARRTIAKYREALGISASSERKKMNYFKG